MQLSTIFFWQVEKIRIFFLEMLPEMSCENRHMRNSKQDETALSEDKLRTVMKERIGVDSSIFVWHFTVAAALVVFWSTDM